MPWQFRAPPQSPVPQAFPPPELPLLLKEQFVLAQTRPCQFAETVWFLLSPAASSKPVEDGPLPFCVWMPGQIVSVHLFVTTRGVSLLLSRDDRPGLRFIWWTASVDGMPANMRPSAQVTDSIVRCDGDEDCRRCRCFAMTAKRSC